MSLDKSISPGKEHRKPYSGAKDIDVAFRNHGSCKWRDNFTWICFNGDSEMCADVADDEYCRECRLFEVKENE